MNFIYKKKYTLIDIQKLFSKIPIAFILILAVLLVLITYFVLDFKKNSLIELIQQKHFLNYKFSKKEEINNFKTNVNEQIKNSFSEEEILLKKITYKVIGYLESGIKSDTKKWNKYINAIEKNNNVRIVIFKKNNLKILRGKNFVDYIQNIIFSSTITEQYSNIVLQYIYSQGKNNLQYWRDSVNNTIRLSFFDNLILNNSIYYVGCVSTIGSLEYITKKSIINSINRFKFDIWFYDLTTKETYNFHGNKSFDDSINLIEANVNSHNIEILKYFSINKKIHEKFKDFVYLDIKNNFFISTFYNLEIIRSKTKDIISSINKKYKKTFLEIILYITIIIVFFIFFTFIFSSFIKKIINKYYDELKAKTVLLEHWKKRFELAIIASNDGLWDIDFKTKKIYFSDKWLEMFGYKKGEIVTFENWFELIHNEDKADVKKQFDKIFNKKSDSIICEYRLKTKLEEFKWVLARGKAFFDVNKQLNRMLMMSMDIDKTKRMKKELLDIELLVNDGKIVIFKIFNDANLSFKFVSQSIKNFGYSKKNLESGDINFVDLIHDDDRNQFIMTMSHAVKNDLPNFKIECRIVDRSNKVKWTSCRMILIKNHSGKIGFFYGYINDITKIKLSQEELKLKIKEELDKNREKDRILIQQSKLASMGEMLGNIAHQWRQPLNNVSLILQFLRDNYKEQIISTDKLDSFMKKANKHIEYLSDTIDDFKDFYKPSKNQNRFCVSECIESLLNIIENQYNNDMIEIQFKPQKCYITNYENEFKQALLNILNNAKDAILTKKINQSFNAVIKISLKKDNDKLFITIINNGGSIKDDIIDKIFEPYFTTKFETKGTGIGLYMTQYIIEKNMKGSIKVKNIHDSVSFTITLKI